MNQRTTVILLAVAGSTACSSDDRVDRVDDRASPATVSAPSQPAQPAASPPSTSLETPMSQSGTAPLNDPVMALSSCDQPLDTPGIAFVDVMFPVSDFCPARRMGPNSASNTQLQMTRDAPGRACLRGRLTDGWATLIVGFDGSNKNGLLPLSPGAAPFDADSAGVRGVHFTLDTPPAGGLTVETAYVVGESCFPNCELHGDFYLMGDSGLARSFDQSGSYNFQWPDFQLAPWGDPLTHLDTTHLPGMFFHLPAGDFDFCLSDFYFLDADGAPVR